MCVCKCTSSYSYTSGTTYLCAARRLMILKAACWMCAVRLYEIFPSPYTHTLTYSYLDLLSSQTTTRSPGFASVCWSPSTWKYWQHIISTHLSGNISRNFLCRVYTQSIMSDRNSSSLMLGKRVSKTAKRLAKQDSQHADSTRSSDGKNSSMSGFMNLNVGRMK